MQPLKFSSIVEYFRLIIHFLSGIFNYRGSRPVPRLKRDCPPSASPFHSTLVLTPCHRRRGLLCQRYEGVVVTNPKYDMKKKLLQPGTGRCLSSQHPLSGYGQGDKEHGKPEKKEIKGHKPR